MKTGLLVHDCMTTTPISIDNEASIHEASKIMLDNHVGALLVTSKGKRGGIISERDIVRKAIAKGINPIDKSVKEFATTDLITIVPEADIYEAIIKMRDNNIRHLPVVEGDKYIGFISVKDILKIEPQLFEIIVEKFEIMEWERKSKARNKAMNLEGI